MIAKNRMLTVTVKEDTGTTALMHFPDWEAFYAFLYFFYGLREHMWNVEKDVTYNRHGERIETGFGYMDQNNPNDITVYVPLNLM